MSLSMVVGPIPDLLVLGLLPCVHAADSLVYLARLLIIMLEMCH